MESDAHLTYLAASNRIGIRPWRRRRDRRDIDHWPAYSPALPAHWLAAAPASGERVSYAIDLLGGHLVGRIGLLMRADAPRLGIVLHPGNLGSGIGTEALFLLQRIGQQQGWATLQLDVAAENERAIRCYARTGFVTIGSEWRGGYRYCLMERGL